MKKLFLLSLTTILCLPSLLAQNDYPTELRPFIEKQMKKNHIQGMSLALVDDQTVIWAEGFGYADKATGKLADTQTFYRVGSISKLFTALSIMQLYEQGKLDLDVPVSTYVPEFAPKSRLGETAPITIRHLLTHESGLPSDVMQDFFTPEPPSFTVIVDLLNEEYLCTPPNTVWSYSNAGFSLLGVVVERVSGEDFFSYTQRHLFEPMDMPNAYFRLREDMQALYSTAYLGKGKAYDEPQIRDVPAGLLHANVAEFTHFIQMLHAGGNYQGRQIIRPETLTEMLRVQTADVALDYDLTMGLCFFRSFKTFGYAGGFAGHGGATRAFHAQFGYLPEQKLGVVILTNSESGGGLASSLLTKVLKEALKLRRELEPPAPDSTLAEEPKLKIKAREDEQLRQTAGYYAAGPLPIHFEYRKGRLTGKVQGLRAEIVPNNLDSYTTRLRLLGVIVLPQKDQLISFAKVGGYDVIEGETRGRKSRFAVKITPNPVPDAWKDHRGTYVMRDEDIVEGGINIFTKIEVVEKDGLLYLKSKKYQGEGQSTTMGINPVNDTEAVIYGLGRNCGATVFWEERNGQQILRFWGLEFVRQ